MKPLRSTKSLCPVCLAKIDASIIEENGSMYMVKTCPEHGVFKSVVWRESKEKYLEWIEAAGNQVNGMFPNPVACGKGCPFDCGYCAVHKQDVCSAALMVTERCNLNCPVCFTRTEAKELYHPDTAQLKGRIMHYLEETKNPLPS